MLPFFWYILKVIICSGILFGYYWLFLRNKIFHQYNRFYLLASLVLSLTLPILKIDFWQQDDQQQSQVIKALQAVSAGDEYMSNVIITADGGWSAQQFYSIVYWTVCLVFFFVLLRTLFVIRSLLRKYPVQIVNEFSFVNTEDKSTPFSFLKYIFWNSNIDMDTSTGKQIFKHEVAHIQEKHTYDKLFINTLLIFFWCNPFFWLYRKELNMIHEFIADKKAVEDCDTASFAAMILQATYPQHRFQLTNNFFYSPIKRRLLMLTKNNNPRINYAARLMVLPLAALVFAAFSFKVKSSNEHLKASAQDTVPALTFASQVEKTGAVEELDPNKALLIINGKIIGKGITANGEFNQLYAQTVSVKWLQKKDAITKYGGDGADGACEVSYTEGATIKTAYVDENNVGVFYIGLDNPITINAQNVKPEELVVTLSKGKIQGTAGVYMVKVTQPGEVTIKLSKRDGSEIPGTFTIMAKLLPDPGKTDLKKLLIASYTDTVPLAEKLPVESKNWLRYKKRSSCLNPRTA
jgi:BlaR1 peptidase M56/GldM C-terminal domain